MSKVTRGLSRVMETFYILFGMMITWRYTTVKTHQIEHLRSVCFIEKRSVVFENQVEHTTPDFSNSAVCTLQNIEFFNTLSVTFISFMPLDF